jgi:hypothetical protein
VQELESGPLHRFQDWPNEHEANRRVPTVRRFCEPCGAVLGIASGFDVWHLGMTHNGSGAPCGLPWLRVVCRGAGVDLAHRLLA